MSHLEHELHLAHALELLPHPLLRTCRGKQWGRTSIKFMCRRSLQ
jgi:hypothetical protein